MAASEEQANSLLLSGNNLDDYIRGLFGSLVVATKASNAIPSADFADAAQSSGQSIADLLARFVKYGNGGQGPEVSEDLADPALYEVVVDAIDGLLEEADLFMDELQGKKSHEEVARVIRQVMKYDKDRIIRENVKDIPKPQEAFMHEIRNSRTEPFNFQLLNKPHAISPIPTLVPVETVDMEVIGPSQYMPHVYEQEIARLNYNDWQLIAPVTPQISVPFTAQTFTYIDTEAAFVDFLDDLVREIDDGSVREIAVDLEAHSHRSFQGLTCLMQISTRQHDYVLDTLALRSQMNRLLEVFANPQVVKVMHGAEKDILWLQRDFQIFVVNLFDTYHAAKLMRYPALSLAHLLKYHCGVSVNKKYQLDDWRQRPLPADMLAYARSDTHYLLFVYDAMLREIELAHPEDGIVSVLDACKRVCLQRHEKELFRPNGYRRLLEQAGTATSALQIGPDQETVLSRLWDWRDLTARNEDESPVYVMSKAELLRIALRCPKSEAELQQCGPLSPLVRANARELLGVINSALDIRPMETRSSMDVVHSAITPKHGSVSSTLNLRSQGINANLAARLKGYNTAISFTLAVPAIPVASLNRDSPTPSLSTPSPVPDTDEIYRLAGWRTPVGVPLNAHNRSFSDSDAMTLASPGGRSQDRNLRQVAEAQRDLALHVLTGSEEAFVSKPEAQLPQPVIQPHITANQEDENEAVEMSLEQVPQSMAEIYQLSNRTRRKYKEKKRAKDSAGSGASIDIDFQSALQDSNAQVDLEGMSPELVESYFPPADDNLDRSLESTMGFTQGLGWISEADAPGVLAEMTVDQQQPADYSSDGSDGPRRAQSAKHSRTGSRGKEQGSAKPEQRGGGSARKYNQQRDNKKPRQQPNDTFANEQPKYAKLVHHRSMGALSALEHSEQPPPQSKNSSFNPFIGAQRPNNSAGRGNPNRPRVEQREKGRSMTYGRGF